MLGALLVDSVLVLVVEGRWGYCGQGCGDQHVQEEYSEDVPTLIKSLAAEIDRLKELVEKVHADDLQTAPCVDSVDDTLKNSTVSLRLLV